MPRWQLSAIIPGKIGYSRLPGIICLSLCLALLAACASVPKVEKIINNADSENPIVHGANGPLSERQSKAIIAKLERDNKNADVLDRHLALESALGNSPLYVGSRLTLFPDGPATFDAIFHAIDSAKDHINLEYYTFENVLDGDRRLGDLLIEKHRQGVVVNVIYDSYGSQDAAAEFLDRLKQAGVNLLSFNPLNPFEMRTGWIVNDRDHRKILVVDGKLAIVGGVNLDTAYTEPVTVVDPETGAKRLDIWRDAAIQIEGPAVVDLQKLFFDTWNNQSGPKLPAAIYYPHIDAQGKEIVRIMGSTPDRGLPKYYISLLSAMLNSEKRIWATAAYFVPTHQEEEALIEAARRGVDVRLFLPSHSDSEMALEVARSHYEDLLEAGVQIYEARDWTLHSKMVVIDSVWAVIGSSNFDHRSVLFNNEVDAVVLGRDMTAQMEALFLDDLAHGDRIDLQKWKQRSPHDVIRDWDARFWQQLL